jgi:hypothetical protein
VQALRYLVVLVTGFIAGSRTVEAVQSWNDRQLFLEHTAVALLSLAIAALVWWLLRPRVGSG